MFPFHIPWKYRKTFNLLVFSGGVKGNIGQELSKPFKFCLQGFPQQFLGFGPIPEAVLWSYERKPFWNIFRNPQESTANGVLSLVKF